MEETRRKILLIDDKLNTPFYISLRDEGYEVIACESPQKAWGLVFPFQPHFIIVHLQHPITTDIAILQSCQALSGGVPIVVASSQGDEAVTKELEQWATAFVSLPAKPRALRKLLDELEPLATEK